MSETNGIYPIMTVNRHEDNCAACLEPQFCECQCATCTESRVKWASSEEYRKYLSDILDPRD